ncbi:hypothetical protein NLJ89_g11185 [Agrocybe chaxingu]|uniref:Uncharacterized protein n=1 Tax=Agrocybe chaxingu TaxID=84603 RepID=A0A9W8MQ77_9AGAR|nr:hypothetical protein NLJ89_g11185 [Agrocybe chaxingu]
MDASRTPLPIVDKDRRLIALFAGHPPDDNWQDEHRSAADELEQARLKLFGKREAQEHRRGEFDTLRCGTSHGGGQREPSNLANSPKRTEVLERLNNHRVFKRLAGFASSVLCTWVPELYDYYTTYLGALYAGDHQLKRTFLSWIFTSTTYNLGPSTICFKHKDFANLPFGWCAVTALGDFDPKKGGHLVLWECGLVVEFPPGSTALLPSATISHSNTAIGAQEHRFSFTQYSAGALFRWVENGFKKATTFEASLTAVEKERRKQDNTARFLKGLGFFPILRSSTST